jgi:uncharacterized membrane protein YhaH (DUF805 family)
MNNSCIHSFQLIVIYLTLIILIIIKMIDIGKHGNNGDDIASIIILIGVIICLTPLIFIIIFPYLISIIPFIFKCCTNSCCQKEEHQYDIIDYSTLESGLNFPK